MAVLTVTVSASLASLGAAPAGAASDSHVRAYTDGRSTAALWDWRDRIVRVVRDGEPMNDALSLPAPEGCELSGIGGGKLLFTCVADRARPWATGPRLFDLASGAWEHPPAMAALLEHTATCCLADSNTLTWDAVGAALIRLHVNSPRSDSRRLFRLSTGEIVRGHESPTEIASLDDPTGARPLCAPVRRASRSEHGRVDTYLVFEPAQYVGAWTVRWWDGRIWLQRCGSRRTRPLAIRAHSAPVLTDRYVAFAGATALHVHWLRSGRRQILRLPRPFGTWPQLQLAATRSRLFIADARDGWPADRPIQLALPGGR